MITPENIASQEYQANFESWKQFATDSLKGKSLEHYLKNNSIEGIEKSIFYDAPKDFICSSYPQEQVKVQFYDLKKYSEEFYKEDQELGLSQFIFQLQENPKDLSYLNKNNTFLHLQKATDEMLNACDGFNVFIDVNDLIFKSFEEEITRVLSKNNSANFLIDLSHVHNAGGSVVQELTYGISLFAALLERGVKTSQICLRVSCHSEIFLNIAKLKSLRYLLERMCDQACEEYTFSIHGTNSLREQTLYDPWSNMLRNCSSTMAQILGGANTISTRSFDYLFARLTVEKPSPLGHRYAAQTLNILFEESHLDQIVDPTKGSFYIDNIATEITIKVWESFLNWRERNFLESAKDFSIEVAAISKSRTVEIRKRKKVITGVNDYADPTQTIKSLYNKDWQPVELNFGFFPLRRLAREFEMLRIENEFTENKKNVLILTEGKLSKINARLNFIKNVFDTASIPYEVKDFVNDIKTTDYAKTVLCAPDEAYEGLIKQLPEQELCIAGKLNLNSEKITEIYMGMNVYEFNLSIISEGTK